MTYTIDINGKRYELSESFREAITERARREYRKNNQFSCWWSVQGGDPILTIETEGVMVPWEQLETLDVQMTEYREPPEDDPGNGMLIPEDEQGDDVFDPEVFALTPHRFEEVPTPENEDPEKIPTKPERFDEPAMIMWVPDHPDIDEVWGAGEAITSISSWVEWNVQKKADQPRPTKDKRNSHDSFESLCRIHDCEVVGEYEQSDTPEKSGSVERKGEQAFDEGRFGGGHWDV